MKTYRIMYHLGDMLHKVFTVTAKSKKEAAKMIPTHDKKSLSGLTIIER